MHTVQRLHPAAHERLSGHLIIIVIIITIVVVVVMPPVVLIPGTK